GRAGGAGGGGAGRGARLAGSGRWPRLEQDRGRVQLPAAPGGPLVEQVWPRQAQQQERRTAGQVGDVVDQIEERLLAPLDVVEDHDQRPFARDVLKLATDIPEQLALAEPTIGQPRQGLLRPLAQLLEDRDDRPERDPLAVLQTPARQRGGIEPGDELRYQPRLAHAGRAKHGEQVAAPLADRALERLPELLELGAAADERLVQAPGH